MKWIAFLSGTHPTRETDNPWDVQTEGHADSFMEALVWLAFVRGWGSDFCTEGPENLDGLIRPDWLDVPFYEPGMFR